MPMSAAAAEGVPFGSFGEHASMGKGTGTNEESGTSVFLVWSLTGACYGGGQIEFGGNLYDLYSHPHLLTYRGV